MRATTTRSSLRGVVVALLLLLGVANALLEGLGDNTAPTNNNLDSANLIDQVLSSDYFEDDKDAPPAPEGGQSQGHDPEPEVTTSRAPACLGCPMEVDVEDPKIKAMAGFAFAAHLNDFQDVERAQQMIRVVNAMTQIVAGQKYILDLEVSE